MEYQPLNKMKTLSRICLASGIASILGSMFLYFGKARKGRKELSYERSAHAERFGIFMGLWAPTFFILSNLMERFEKERARKELA